MLQLPRDIKIIYASTSGNVEATCEYVATLLEGHHFEVRLARAEKVDATEVINGQLFIFATSTWAHGEINPYFEPVLHDINHLEMSGKLAGFIGLGDTRYEPVLFTKGIDIVHDAFLKKGGQAVAETLRIDGEPYHQFEGLVKDWTHTFISELINHKEIELT